MATFPFRFDPRFAPCCASEGSPRTNSVVEVDEATFTARFGRWPVETPTTNLARFEITGDYRWWRAIGVRGSLADRGITFGSNADAGVCVCFRDPIDRLGAVGAPRAPPALTVTVDDVDGLAETLAGYGVPGPTLRHLEEPVAAISLMMPLGTEAPDFALTDVVTGRTVSRDDFADAKALLVMFICNHCPYVKHVAPGWPPSARTTPAPTTSPSSPSTATTSRSTRRTARRPCSWRPPTRGYRFPYLFDETQEVARAYSAACTPDFFLFGPDRGLVYRGRMDESRPNSLVPVTGEELRAAIEAVRAGEPVAEEQFPSMGCSIKYREG